MAITRTIHHIDIQWTDTDDGGGGFFKDPVVTLVATFLDDVEGTEASRHLVALRSDLGAPAQAKLDDFLANIIMFAEMNVPGPINFPT